MKRLAGWFFLLLLAFIPPTPAVSAARGSDDPAVRVVQLTPALERRLQNLKGERADIVRAGLPYLGTPYVWGGTSLERGIDCSNFIWLVARAAGRSHGGFLGTQTMALHRPRQPLREISFAEAASGDLLVYGARDGRATGHPGLVLGAHGDDVGGVRLITYRGFEEGYFKHPHMKLSRVLRLDPASGAMVRDGSGTSPGKG